MFPARPQHGLNLSTSTSTHRINLERLPKTVNTRSARLRSSINQDANIRVQHGTKGLEKPTMRVDLFLILFLQTEHDLYWAGILSSWGQFDDIVFIELNPDLSCVLERLSA